MVTNSNELKEKLKSKLKEIFQFENEDLNFGIYKIMNHKQKEIGKFIEEELIGDVEKQLALFGENEKTDIEKRLKEISSKNGVKKYLEAVKIKDGKRAEIYREDFKKEIEEYEKLEEQLGKIKISEDLEREIYNHLINFFSRYYDSGDFISKRRYGRNEKYVIPHNGEEIALYWANKDQYYIKTTEYFRKYTFRAKGLTVNFMVVETEEEKGNVKAHEKKFFVLNKKNKNVFDFDNGRELNIYFEYRALTDNEKEIYKHGNTISQDKVNEETINILNEKIPQNNFLARFIFEKEGEKTIIEKHLYRYTKRNTTDYFIHQDLKGFLERELDFYIKNEFLQLEDLQVLEQNGYFDKLRLYLIGVRAFRKIALKIIEFLAQIENFQKKIWEKKKFVIDTHYVITLEKIKEYAGEEFLESILNEILRNKKQVEEWKELFGIMVREKKDLIENDEQLQLEGKEWKKLPIDTKYFDEEFKWNLLVALSENNDLDEILDGVLIKSENWQALNLLLNKYYEKVQTIYIDPPYNTGSDEFLYKDKYQHSSWLTMIENRLELAKEFLREDGVIFVSIDDNEEEYLMNLMDSLYNKVEKMKIRMRNPARQLTQKSLFQKSIEYCLVFSKSNKPAIKLKEKEYDFSEYKYKIIEKSEPIKTFRIGNYSIEEFLPNQYEIISCNDINDPYIVKEISIRGKIKSAQFTGKFYEENLRKFFEKEKNFDVLYKVFGIGEDGFGFRYIKNPSRKTINATYYQGIPLNIRQSLSAATKEVSYYDFYDFEKEMNHESKKYRDMGISSISSIKPLNFIIFLINIVKNTQNNVILDFFAGSGTTAHAVMKLNKEDGGRRKFILIEMADYFDTVIIPRIKKVAYSLNWKEGRPQNTDGIGIFFKYHTLEQYEDALENIEFEEPQNTLALYDYFVKYMLEWETKKSKTFLNIDKLKNPLSYKLKTIENYQQKNVNVDMIETFNYLLGLHISRYKTSEEKGRKYVFVYGKKEGKRVAIVWRSLEDIDFEKDKEVIECEIKKFNPDEVYINGDAVVKGFKPIDPEFKSLMFN